MRYDRFQKLFENCRKGNYCDGKRTTWSERATIKLLRHFYVVVLKSSTQIYRGHLRHFCLCQLSTESSFSESALSKLKKTYAYPIRIHKDHERLNAHAVDSAECYAKRAIKNFRNCYLESTNWNVYIPYLRDDAPTRTILTNEQPY